VSVRLRLAAWFVLVMAVLVVATSAITYAIVRSDLRGEAQRSAKRLARAAARGEPNELRLDGMAAPGDRIWVTGAGGAVLNSTTGAPGHTLAGVRRAIDRAPSGATSARVARSDGGEAIVLLANHSVASTLDTLLRTLVAVGERERVHIAAARARVRRRVWALISDRVGRIPPSKVADVDLGSGRRW